MLPWASEFRRTALLSTLKEISEKCMLESTNDSKSCKE